MATSSLDTESMPLRPRIRPTPRGGFLCHGGCDAATDCWLIGVLTREKQSRLPVLSGVFVEFGNVGHDVGLSRRLSVAGSAGSPAQLLDRLVLPDGRRRQLAFCAFEWGERQFNRAQAVQAA